MKAPRRIESATAALEKALQEAAETPSERKALQPAATALGSLVATKLAMAEMTSELTELMRQLERHDGSLPTRRLDPFKVLPSRWCNRSTEAFETKDFARLKADIAAAGGNLQPILVREAEGDRFEIAFGHRRHRACLELGLPVLAVIWSGQMSDADLVVAMDRENRERVDPSPYEQGAAYSAALDAGLFPSRRRLAEALGVSHTWVGKAIAVAGLPTEVVSLLGGPLRVQPKHAVAISAARAADPAGVAQRVAKMAARPGPHRASEVVSVLLGRPHSGGDVGVIDGGGRQLATWRRERSGRVVIVMASEVSSDAAMTRVAGAIRSALAPEDVGHAQR